MLGSIYHQPSSGFRGLMPLRLFIASSNRPPGRSRGRIASLPARINGRGAATPSIEAAVARRARRYLLSIVLASSPMTTRNFLPDHIVVRWRASISPVIRWRSRTLALIFIDMAKTARVCRLVRERRFFSPRPAASEPSSSALVGNITAFTMRALFSSAMSLPSEIGALAHLLIRTSPSSAALIHRPMLIGN